MDARRCAGRRPKPWPDSGPRDRVVVGPTALGYRCPPAVFDLAVRIRRATGAQVDVVHPWPAPLAPFGAGPASAATRLLADAGVGFHGGFEVSEVSADALVSASGDEVPYDVAFVVPPHRPPALVADSPLGGPGGWPAVRFPTFGVPGVEDVSVIGDLASAALTVGMAGTLAVHEAAFVADRIAAAAGGPPARDRTGDVGDLLPRHRRDRLFPALRLHGSGLGNGAGGLHAHALAALLP